MSKIRVLIVDDHAVFLEGLHTLLQFQDPGIEVVGTALNGQEALEKEAYLKPDVVLLDIKMPVIDGIEVSRRLKARRPEIRILMLTTFDDRGLIRGALEAGANGYLLKDAHAVDVIEAIKSVNQGNILMTGDLAVKLSRPAAENPASKSAGETTERIDISGIETSRLDELSSREIDVLTLMSEGKNNREISELLFLSEKTVRNYVSHIYEVLNVHSRTRAALWAVENLKRK